MKETIPNDYHSVNLKEKMLSCSELAMFTKMANTKIVEGYANKNETYAFVRAEDWSWLHGCYHSLNDGYVSLTKLESFPTQQWAGDVYHPL